jgi:hypothetical protein
MCHYSACAAVVVDVCSPSAKSVDVLFDEVSKEKVSPTVNYVIKCNFRMTIPRIQAGPRNDIIMEVCAENYNIVIMLFDTEFTAPDGNVRIRAFYPISLLFALPTSARIMSQLTSEFFSM